MRRTIDRTGQRLGFLIALDPAPDCKTGSRSITWRCRCVCGRTIYIDGRNFAPSMAERCRRMSCGCKEVFVRRLAARQNAIAGRDAATKRALRGRALDDAAADLGLSVHALRKRLQRGWDPDDAVSRAKHARDRSGAAS